MAKKLYSYFPRHKIRVDLFFGAGGAFFDLPKPKFAVLNDIDDDVTNLYLVVKNRKEEFIAELKQTPLTSTLLSCWHKNPSPENEILRAVYFLLKSNAALFGKGDTLKLGAFSTKKLILKRIEGVFDYLSEAMICCEDFREVLHKVNYEVSSDVFVYMDPPYLGTDSYIYNMPRWSIKDSKDCLDIMVESGFKCAMSEFSNHEIIKEAKHRNLNIIKLVERRNLETRSQEILITNYEINKQKSLLL